MNNRENDSIPVRHIEQEIEDLRAIEKDSGANSTQKWTANVMAMALEALILSHQQGFLLKREETCKKS